ncbi:MAG: PEP-CTERM sorting domain-containing protein [bacterium]|nr:PEP-CTERM sorting domain-containing protein [bacterium]
MCTRMVISIIVIGLGAVIVTFTQQARADDHWGWQPTPDKIDVLITHAHPDDEGYFLGAVLPYVTQVAQRSAVLLDMVSSRPNNSTEETTRENELRNAAAQYGFVYEPIFARFRDHYDMSPYGLDQAWDAWDGDVTNGVADLNNNNIPDGREAGALFVARQIRMLRPDVVATHDIEGEYGHTGHQATSLSVIDAWSLAADPTVDIDGLSAWQAQKLYIHQSEANGLGTAGYTFENFLFHDYTNDVSIDTDGDGTLDATPIEIGDLGLQKHVSEGAGNAKVSTVYRSGDSYEGHHAEWWGLYASTVGPDTVVDPFNVAGYDYTGWARGDFFENVVVSTPEPGTLTLLLLATSAMVRRRRRL